MKKSNFIALVLSVLGTLVFGLGMCMVLLTEWNLRKPGIVCGAAGLVVLLADWIVWRRMNGKKPIRISVRVVGITALAVAGALMLGAGMSLCMVYGSMVFGILLGCAGILMLLMLIPAVKGLQD